MIDIHSHLLPGIDDGPKTWDAAIALCERVSADGITTSVATPHLIDGIYNNTASRVVPLVEELNQRLAAAGVPLEVLPGAEIDFSSRHVTGETADLPRLGGAAAILLEMPVAVIPPAISETIFAVRARGLIPVIAHPERNEILQEDPSSAQDWVRCGAVLQLDCESILGLWGERTRRCAERLLRRQLFHAMATDAHSVEKRPPRMGEALACVTEILGASAINLVESGPRMILDGVMPPTPLYETNGDPSRRERRDSSRRRSSPGRLARWLGRA